jgi:hypothetical protein
MLRALLLLMSIVTPSGQPKPKQPADYTPAAQSQVVSWQLKRLPPPSPLYVNVDDVLRATVASSKVNEVVTVNYRLLRASDGAVVPGQFTVSPLSNRTVKVQDQPLAEGFLLSVSCKAAVAVTTGATFVRLFLNPKSLGAGQPGSMMMADYVTTAMAPGFPNGRVVSPAEGPGNVGSYGVVAAAGADWVFTVFANARWRVQGVFATYNASAVVATRQVYVEVVDQLGSVLFVTGASVGITASQTVNVGSSAAPVLAVAAPSLAQVPLPPDLILAPGMVIKAVTGGIQGADQWTSVAILVTEWLDNV